MKLIEVDIKTAFLHSDLHENMYMQQPEGIDVSLSPYVKLLSPFTKTQHRRLPYIWWWKGWNGQDSICFNYWQFDTCDGCYTSWHCFSSGVVSRNMMNLRKKTLRSSERYYVIHQRHKGFVHLLWKVEGVYCWLYLCRLRWSSELLKVQSKLFWIAQATRFWSCLK